LTAEPGRRADRALAAALAHLHAGAFDAALALLAQAEADSGDDLQLARVERLRGQIAWASNPGRNAPVRLLRAAARLEPLDIRLARDTYLDALLAALVAGPLAQPGGDLTEVARVARSIPQPADGPQPRDLLLDGLATVVIDGRTAAEPTLRLAMRVFLSDQVSAEDWLQWGPLVSAPATLLWDFDSWDVLCNRHVELARASGALAPLSAALNAYRVLAILRGDFESATSLGVEEDAVMAVTGARRASYGAMLLAAYQGRSEETSVLISANAGEATARGEGLGLQMANWAMAVLHNGLGHYAEALAAGQEAAGPEYGPMMTPWVLIEVIEAAVRNDNAELAADALRRLTAAMAIEGADLAAGLEARARALVSEGAAAEHCYRDAIELLGRTPLRLDLARAHLLYGEWLRREHRRVDARHQLRTAYDAFAAMGADAFAERAGRELLATGAKVRKREVDTHIELTPQEEHIARLARVGRTNPEIGTELFISSRTVEWHLRKVFTKLGIASRRELHDALPLRGRYTAPDSRAQQI
jgi:DNA-binding CsgD family transcriptional regulator